MADDVVQGEVLESAGQFKEAVAPDVQAEREIVEHIKDCFTFSRSYYDVQRRTENDELEFEGEDMWAPEAREARAEQTDPVTGQKIPAKPTLSVNLLDQNIQQVVNEARQARLAITVKPKAGLSNTKTSNYIKGVVRGIQVQSGALEVRLWALERAAKVGRGGYRITADYANDGDFDLDLMLERILDYSAVEWDPYSVRANRSDAEWAQEAQWMPRSERMRRWKDKPLIVPDDGFTTEEHDWFAGTAANEKQQRCRIVTHYEVQHTPYTLGYHPEFGQGWIDKAPEKAKDQGVMPEPFAEAVRRGEKGTRTREVDERSVMIYIVDGTQVLEKRPWHGRYIPLIEVIGKEYFIKGKRRWKGVIANGMDMLRAINVLISAATEMAGSIPRAPYIMAEGQDEGHEAMWDDAFVKNYTRLYYKPVEVGGKPAQAPQRQQREPEIQGLVLLLRVMQDMYHGITGSVAPQLRAVNPYDRSGKAIEALQRQGAAGTSNYLDNLATISMLYEGEVVLDAIPHYYDRPGRIINVMGEDNDDETSIMIKQPFVRGKDGEPVPVPCPACQGTGEQQAAPSGLARFNPFAQPQAETCRECQGSKLATKDNAPEEWAGKAVEYVDFGEGQYKVQAAVDRSFKSKQEEALAGMSELAKASPEMVPMYADLWVRAMGFSGSNEIADRIKAQNPALADDADLEGVPPAMVARYKTLHMQHQQAMQALGEAQKLLETDAVKQAGQKEIAIIKGALSEKLEQVKLHGKMLQVKVEGQHDAALEVLRGKLEGLQQEAEHRHEILLQLLKELGAKEQERHSVALHDAAAARADERLNLNATRDAARSAVSADLEHARGESSAVREHARNEVSADRQAHRDDTAASRDHARSESSAESADARAAAREREAREAEKDGSQS